MKYLLLFLILVTPSVFAGAPDLWKYEPELKNMNIQLTGHKVDALGNAVNDSVYTRTIDHKVGTARTAQGKVGMNRLLKVSGWGVLGTYALEQLLEGVGWIIDPASQSIWRNKPTSGGGTGVSCSGQMFKDGQWYNVKWQGGFGLKNCPLEAVQDALKDRTETSSPYFEFTFIRWGDDVKPNLPGWQKAYYFNAPWGQDVATISAYPQDKSDLPQDRETMTPEILSDYVNKTHPDYSDPNLAPKLAPNWNPQLAPDLWTPANQFEETNSPTVQIAKKELDKANPTSPDSEVKPNPETGGSTLPSFCSWASIVCDFLRDENIDKDLEEQEPDTSILDKKFETDFSANGSCPPNPTIEFPLVGTVELPFTKICDFFSFLRFGVLTGASLLACWIVASAVKGGEA